MTDQQVQELRSTFFQKLEKDGAPDVGKFIEYKFNTFYIYLLCTVYLSF